MEQWSVTLTGDVQPGADAASAWQRVAEKLGHDREAFEQKIRQRLPVTFRATDNSGAQRHLRALEACGVDGLVLADDGQRLWVRIDDTTRGPVSMVFARRALTHGEWDGQTQVCRTGEKQWQPLQAVIPVPEPQVQEPAPPPPPEPEAATPSPAPAGSPDQRSGKSNAYAAALDPHAGYWMRSTASVLDSLSPAPSTSPNHWSGELPTHVETPGLHAGFWMRVLPYLLDSLILFAGLFVFRLGYGQASEGTTIEVGWQLISLVVYWLYHALFESSGWQATPGKRALGLRVVDMHGARIGFGRATGRFFGRIISAIILGVGYMMAGWTVRKQTLHDMMAGCCVVRQSGLDALAEEGVDSRRIATPGGMPGWAIALLVCGGLGIFVVPILAAIAIPAYQDYVVRAQVSEGMALSDPIQSSVENYLQANGWLPENNQMAGLVAPTAINGKYVQAVGIVNGNVVVAYGGQANDNIHGKRLMFIAQRDGLATSWACTSPDIPNKYLPAKCRE